MATILMPPRFSPVLLLLNDEPDEPLILAAYKNH